MTTDTDASPWPTPPDMARLNWADGLVVHTRVDQTEEDLLMGRTAVQATLPVPGTSAELEWGDHHGLFIRAVTVVTAYKGLLEVSANAPAERIQRRRFFRAATSLNATIAHGSTETRGQTLDLSEGGARVRVEGTAPLSPTQVTTHLHVDGAAIAVPGRVVRDACTEGVLGLEFDELAAGPAAAIRKEVFSAQLEARRKGIRT